MNAAKITISLNQDLLQNLDRLVRSRVFPSRSEAVQIAVALTSQEPNAAFPLTMEIIGTGLPKRSWVKISQIRTLSVARLGNKIGSATAEELTAVLEGLNEILGS